MSSLNPDSVSPPGTISVTRTYLELRDVGQLRPSGRIPSDPYHVVELVNPTAADARMLYLAVGSAWQWTDRLGWSDEALAEWVGRSSVRTFRLDDASGGLVGYLELVRHEDESCEIGYFGLVPAAIGRGIGGWFLAEAVRMAWSFALPDRPPVQRVWLHTCTLDAPAALPNYLARGFVVTRTEQYQVARPEVGDG
jgi:GNAT superfamily N-acetyltransferase